MDQTRTCVTTANEHSLHAQCDLDLQAATRFLKAANGLVKIIICANDFSLNLARQDRVKDRIRAYVTMSYAQRSHAKRELELQASDIYNTSSLS